MSAGPNIYAHHAAAVLRECGGDYAQARRELIDSRNASPSFEPFYRATLRALEIAETAKRRERAQ